METGQQKIEVNLPQLFQQHPMLYTLSKTLYRQTALTDEDKTLLFYTLNLLGYCLNQGHIALDLKEYEKQKAPKEWQVNFTFPEVNSWLKKMQIILQQLTDSPVVVYHSLVFLTRLDALETMIAEDLCQRSMDKICLDKSLLSIEKLKNNNEIDWQQLAVINSLTEKLAIIIGGPGTGKTTTVSSLLTAILQQEGHSKYRIALAAPTGKAATRMATSLMGKIAATDLDETLKQCLPEKAQTLHRLLGWSVAKRAFNYHADNPLFLDCLVIDEVSMIDLELFAALLQAVPKSCRLILLGDAYQLPSVQAGSILADICQNQAVDAFSKDKAAWFNSALPALAFTATQTPLADNIVSLKKSYRFRDDKGIGVFAKACLDQDVEKLKASLDEPDIHVYHKNNQGVSDIENLLKAHHQSVLSAATIEQAFATLGNFQLLCANKEGDLSTGFFNQYMQVWAQSQGIPKANIGKNKIIYQGMPILVEQNRYDLGLYNGDAGLIWYESGQFWLCFMDQHQQITRFLPQQIHGWSPAHAITVHKSQGSEYNQVAFVVPRIESPLLNRELLYTAITRAKNQLHLLTEREELEKALASSNRRNSALALRMAEIQSN